MIFKSLKKTVRERQEWFFLVPALFTLCAVVAIVLWGLKPGIDLAGGSKLEVYYDEDHAVTEVQQAVSEFPYGEIRVQTTDGGFMLRQRELTNDEKNALLDTLGTIGEVHETQFNSVGPSIGAEIVRKSWWAIGFVTISIIIYLAFALRHVSNVIPSWKYGMVAVVTLVHDVLIPVGLFAYLGHVSGAEVGVFFIVAILATLGISINDTIVVFDRIRENLRINEEKHQGKRFQDIVWSSVTQTLARSLNTTITVLIMLVSLLVFGPESTKDFALTLIVGMIAGTYSSIMLASPLLIVIERRQPKNKKEES